MMKSNEDQGLQTFYDKIQDNFPNFEGYSDIFPANPDGYFNWWTYCARNWGNVLVSNILSWNSRVQFKHILLRRRATIVSQCFNDESLINYCPDNALIIHTNKVKMKKCSLYSVQTLFFLQYVNSNFCSNSTKMINSHECVVTNTMDRSRLDQCFQKAGLKTSAYSGFCE